MWGGVEEREGGNGGARVDGEVGMGVRMEGGGVMETGRGEGMEARR